MIAMRYEYNHSIQFDLDHLTQYEDVSDLKEKKTELDEVYRKVEAFDEIQKYHKEYMNVMQKQFDEDLRGSNLHVISVGSAVLNYFAEAEEASQ